MSLINRVYTFQDGTTAYGSQVEAEIANIVNVLNNLDTVASTWDQISVKHATLVPLVSDCNAGTQDIADFKNASVTKCSIASNGEITITTAAKGLVVKTPDGTHTYRIAISNNGEITTELVS